MGQPRTPNKPRRLIPHNHNQPTRSLSLVAQIKCHHPVSISLEKQLPKPLLMPGGRVTVRQKGNKDSDVHWFPRYATSTPWKSWKQIMEAMRMSTALWQHPDSMSSRISVQIQFQLPESQSTSVLPSNVHSQITLNLNEFSKLWGLSETRVPQKTTDLTCSISCSPWKLQLWRAYNCPEIPLLVMYRVDLIHVDPNFVFGWLTLLSRCFKYTTTIHWVTPCTCQSNPSSD